MRPDLLLETSKRQKVVGDSDGVDLEVDASSGSQKGQNNVMHSLSSSSSPSNSRGAGSNLVV